MPHGMRRGSTPRKRAPSSCFPRPGPATARRAMAYPSPDASGLPSRAGDARATPASPACHVGEKAGGVGGDPRGGAGGGGTACSLTSSMSGALPRYAAERKHEAALIDGRR